SALRRLRQRGIVKFSKERLDAPITPFEATWARSSVNLTTLQEQAAQQIIKASLTREFSPFLLHGVTGSGKNEVYLEVIRSVLRSGGGVLVVVPEIALTPQLVDRFRARLGDCFAVLHSALHASDRWGAWEKLLRGELRVAIGARSAVFAPIRDLKLIV